MVNPNPRGRDTPPKTARKTTTAKTPKSVIQSALTQQTKAVAGIMLMRGDEYPSRVMETHGPEWAGTMAELADASPALNKALTLLTEGGVVGAAVISTAMMVAPILAYYGALPAAAMMMPTTTGKMEAEEIIGLAGDRLMRDMSPEDMAQAQAMATAMAAQAAQN